MDEVQVTGSSRFLFMTPTLKGAFDEYLFANPTMSNCMLERFAHVVEVSQVRFYTKIALNSGESDEVAESLRQAVLASSESLLTVVSGGRV